jgi:outer membrane protein assembly factor BamA
MKPNHRTVNKIIKNEKDMEESDLMDLYLVNMLTEELFKKGYFLTNN